jgi:DUF438 domain-containing protein
MVDKKAEQLKEILKEAESKDPAEVRIKAKSFLESISSADLAKVEQALLDEGIGLEKMGHLCAAHLELMKGQLEATKLSLPEGHMIETLILEHDEILRFLDQLEELSATLQKAKKFTDLKKDYLEKLKSISHHLVAAEKHHQREEDILFPAVEAHGITGPTAVMVADHQELRKWKHELSLISEEIDDANFDQSKEKLQTLCPLLIQTLRDHIFKENNILYPTALDVIPKSDWVSLGEKADKIGYCCFTPKHHG